MASAPDIVARPRWADALARRIETAPAFVVFLTVVVVGIAVRPVLPVDETRYLTAAWEMWRDGQYLVPHFNGEPYSDKPPLLFWSFALAWGVAGPYDWVARIVPSLFALACLPVTAAVARRMWPDSEGVGGRAALVLATFLAFDVYGSVVLFDGLLALCATLALLAVVRGATGDRRWWWLHGLATGLGVLAKGPVILVFSLPVVVLAPLWAQGVPIRQWYGAFAGSVLVALAVVSMWLIPALSVADDSYRDAILWGQTTGRLVDAFAHARPWWVHLAWLPLIAWPWLWRPPLWRALARLPPGEPMVRCCVAFLLGGLACLSLISGKQPHYLVPLLPGLALLAARALPAGPRRAWESLLPALPLALLLLATAAITGGLVPSRWLTMLPVAVPDMTPVVLVLAALLLALWLGRDWRLPALLAPVLLIVGQLVGAEPLRQLYDVEAESLALRSHQDRGIAYAGANYAGEFSFPARLTVPVTELLSDRHMAAWIAAHPGGAIIGKSGRMAPDWEPARTFEYHNHTYRFWHVPEPRS